ncbi:hypothetical protein AB8A20_08085 [Tardiphaga sp. 604_B6_N1_1]|uniref:hypothetical protein n=1 Tax=unclassified Tardiphaga TaxID=2631404 RepID=UPI003F205871
MLVWRPWIVAGLAIVAIELTIVTLGVSPKIDRTNFLQFSFNRPDPLQRLIVFHKIRAFENSSPTIVQSGDSSGFYGIDSRIVTSHLPAGASYLNMSCCANLGYNGYYNVLDLMAEKNPSIKYMVLHITPYTMPRPELWDSDGANLWGTPDLKVFGEAIYTEFLGFWQSWYLPSMAFRKEVTSSAYYLAPLLNKFQPAAHFPPEAEPPVDFLRARVGNAPYLEFLENFKKANGWTPETDVRGGVYASECDVPTPSFFNLRTLSEKTYIQEVFESFASLAKRHKATLVIVFQPVACIAGAKSAEASAIIDRFKQDHPEVVIPFPFIETWPDNLFSVPAHIRREHTDLVGERLGVAMGNIMRERRSESP